MNHEHRTKLAGMELAEIMDAYRELRDGPSVYSGDGTSKEQDEKHREVCLRRMGYSWFKLAELCRDTI